MRSYVGDIYTWQTFKDEYDQGDTVITDIRLNNSGDAEDVVVSASIKRYGSGDIVDGLILSTLNDLSGEASFSPQWDCGGFEPGYYTVEVELKDTTANLLDRQTEMFRLGIYSGEITSFTAMPEHFGIGDGVDISMTFSNNGTVDIPGTAVIKVQDEAGEMIEEFRHDFSDLAPSDSISFDDTWDTSEAEEGSYSIVGYVLYDAKSSDPESATVNAETGPAKFPWLWVGVGIGAAILLVAGIVLGRRLSRRSVPDSAGQP